MGDRVSDFLKDWGLKENEIRIYLFLLQNGVSKATMISKSLGIFREQVYRTLEDLQKKGIVDVSLDTPLRFIAVPFETLFSQKEKDLRETLSKMKTKKEALFRSLEQMERKNSNAIWKMRIVEGEDRRMQEFAEMKDHARTEICSMVPCDTFFSYERAGAHHDFYVENRTYAYRCILLIDRKPSEKEKKVLSKLSQQNKLEIRYCRKHHGPDMYPCFAIRDAVEFALLISTPGAKRNVAVLRSNNKILSALLQQLFENEWNTARSIIDTTKQTDHLRVAVQPSTSEITATTPSSN